jgi:catechol 2,3-dioxygenase-like lactoylglutathione lyase family enzyme
MRLSKLPYLTLWAVKFEDELRLYKDVLGLPVAEENPNFIMFDTAGSRLAFHKLPKGHQLDRPTVEIHFEVNDVDTVYSSLQTRGIRFDEKPENKPWGTRAASFKDPEGFTVEIIGPFKEGEPARHG